MKIIYFLMFFLVFTNFIYCQDSINCYKIIELNQIFDTKGVIFNKDYKYVLKNYVLKSYEPTIEEILKGEKIINNILMKITRGIPRRKEIINGNLRQYYRQYLGLKNNKGENLLLINMLDFSGLGYIICSNYTNVIINTEGLAKKHYRTFIINLDKNILDEISPDGILDKSWFLKNWENIGPYLY